MNHSSQRAYLLLAHEADEPTGAMFEPVNLHASDACLSQRKGFHPPHAEKRREVLRHARLVAHEDEFGIFVKWVQRF